MTDETKTIHIPVSATMRYVLLMSRIQRDIASINASHKAAKKPKGTDLAFLNEVEVFSRDLHADIVLARRLYERVVEERESES